MSSSVYFRSSGFCCLSRSSISSRSASAVVFGRAGRGGTPAAAKHSRWSSSMPMWPLIRSSQSAGQLGQVVLDLVGIPGEARRPPVVRHRVLVVRVVARVLPVGPRLTMFGISAWSSGWMTPSRTSAGDLRRCRIADVVAAALAVLAQLGHLGHGIGEVVVLDLDAVLVLELGDGVLADVRVPVVDEQLASRASGPAVGAALAEAAAAAAARTAVAATRSGRRRARAADGGGEASPACAHAATIGASAAAAPSARDPLEQLAAGDPVARPCTGRAGARGRCDEPS